METTLVEQVARVRRRIRKRFAERPTTLTQARKELHEAKQSCIKGLGRWVGYMLSPYMQEFILQGKRERYNRAKRRVARLEKNKD